MGLNKKILFGSIAIAVSTTAVVGTVVGINNNTQTTTSIQNSLENKEEDKVIQNSSSQQDKNQEIDIEQEDQFDLDNELIELADSITKENLLVNGNKAFSSLYAFNVSRSDLKLDDSIKVPSGIKVSFEINSIKNDANSLNSGKLDVRINLKKEASIARRDFELTGFKKAEITDFSNLLKTQEDLVLEINVENEIQQTIQTKSYVSLDFLNETEIDSSKLNNADNSLRAIVKENQKINGLTYWLNQDQNKKAHLSDVSLEGEVKLEKISSQNQKAIFHLVAKDTNSYIKLIKGKDANKKEIVLNEIKTTNLLATDVTVVSMALLDPIKQQETLKAFKEIQDTEKKYLTDQKDFSLDRILSINLNEPKNNTDRLFIKPSVSSLEKDTKTLPVSIVVTFGKDDYLTSFDTSIDYELEQLKTAGFKFGIYSLKLTETELVTKKQIIKDKKSELEKYFKQSNYINPSPRSEINNPPSEIKLTKVEDLKTNNKELILDLTEVNNQNQNYLVFADYSYLGIDQQKVLFTPNLSVFHIQNTDKKQSE